MALLHRLHTGLAASLRLSGRQFAAVQQTAAFHLSATLDARRKGSDSDGSSSSDSEDEEPHSWVNPKLETPQQAARDEEHEFLPLFDPSVLRSAGAPAAAAACCPPPLLLVASGTAVAIWRASRRSTAQASVQTAAAQRMHAPAAAASTSRRRRRRHRRSHHRPAAQMARCRARRCLTCWPTLATSGGTSTP